jgi:threonine/homoserine/homoserine lactone efflux protein
VRTLLESRRVASGGAAAQAPAGRALSGRGGLRQGILSNLSNPKVGIFFTSLLPQFVSTHAPALPQMLLLGAIFIAFNLVWMSGYAVAAVRLSDVLSRTRVKATIDRISGLVLVGVGVGLALDR